MAKEINADEFYEKVLSGSQHSTTRELPHADGSYITVEMTALPKRDIAECISDMPQELFDAAQDDVDTEAAEEFAEGDGSTAAVDEHVVEGFEKLASRSLKHDSLSDSQMEQIVKALDFEGLFQVGAEVLNFSIENSGDVQGFREQS